MTRNLKLVVVMVVLLGAFLLTNLLAQTKEVRPLKIGVVNLNTVFEQYKKRARLRQKLPLELEEFRQEMNKLMEQKSKELNALRLRLDMVREGTPEWEKTARELLLRQAELQSLDNLQGIRREQLLARDFQLIYADIRAAVKDFAEDNDYDLILKSDRPELTSSRPDFLPMEMSMRGILHYRETLDVTQQVLEVVNQKFEAQEAGK